MIDILREVAAAEAVSTPEWDRERYEATIARLSTRLSTTHDPAEDEDWAYFDSEFGFSGALWAGAPLYIATSPVVYLLGFEWKVHETLVDDLTAPRIYVTPEVVQRFPTLRSDLEAAEPEPCVISVLDFSIGQI